MLASGDLPIDCTRTHYTFRLDQQHSVEVLTALRRRLGQQADDVLPKGLLCKAITYMGNQRNYLNRCADDCIDPIYNNAVEHGIRPFIAGRKTRMFIDVLADTHASAISIV
ncbi:IS66 family transposase [Undibacterium sp. Ji50W]|uniref:IS66 family transposase n=1 Tax=Undibacterium sp. Ji50W TaxID=3413041 RepID=UPI003BEFCE76